MPRIYPLGHWEREPERGIVGLADGTKQTRRMVLEIALPGYWAEDLTQEQADEFFEGNMDELIYSSLSLVTDKVRVQVRTGDKGGEDEQDVEGIIVGYRVEEVGLQDA